MFFMKKKLHNLIINISFYCKCIVKTWVNHYKQQQIAVIVYLFVLAEKKPRATPKSSAKEKPAAKPALDSQSDTLSRYVHIRQSQMVFKIVTSNGDIVLDRSEGFNWVSCKNDLLETFLINQTVCCVLFDFAL